ncbi:MAG TPA: NRDE family protein [Candidatus Binatia bacterium]|nr:NRDE family protein [Candidatus Binatia bacterium]
MCTLALYFKVFSGYSLAVAANRDEHYDRPSAPPSIIERSPTIVAGRDLRAGGTWLGINEYGLVVGILNRRQQRGLLANGAYRSRGLLCLDLLRLRRVADVDQVLLDLAP